MGTEQSKNEERPRPSNSRQQGVSRDEVNRLLEQQWREYERKLQELNVRPAPTTNSNANQHVQIAEEAKERDLDQIIAQQVQHFVQIAYNNLPSASSSSAEHRPSLTAEHRPSPTAAQRPSPSSSSAEHRPSLTAEHRPSPTAAQRPSPSSSSAEHRPSPTAEHRPSPTAAQRPSPSSSSAEHRPSPTAEHRPSPTAAQRPSPSPAQGLSPLSAQPRPVYNNSPSSSAAQRPVVNNPSPIHSPSTSGTAGVSTSSTLSIERNRNPYSFTRKDLLNAQSPKSPQTNLYPNLNAANANLVKTPETAKPLDNKGFNSNNNRGSGEGYHSLFIHWWTKRNQPSAPPLPTGAISKTSYQPSQSRPTNSNKNVDRQYNCITCNEKYGLSIFQCYKGHSSCRDCKMRGVLCGICRGPIGDTRNITLEALISEVKLAECVAEAERKTECPNSADGCTLLLKMSDIDAHLKECPFNEFACPLSVIFGQRERCRWRGKVTQMVAHFDDLHPEHRQANVDTEMVLINILHDKHIVHLVDMSPFLFLVHLKVADEERKIYMTVQLLGTQISASKWSFELHVYNKREPRRKFVYNEICHSNTMPLEEIFKESKCAAIPQSYALNFVNECLNGCLNYKFFIKRDFEYNPPPTRGKWRGGGRGRGRGRGARANS